LRGPSFKARLLPVSERARHLFGKDEGIAPAQPDKKPRQRTFFAKPGDSGGNDGERGELTVPKPGATVLDRLHQRMILFGAARSEALKRFLVEDGVGRDGRFWRLAQALSALYPAGTEEKRWVDGVLNRKKGLGFSLALRRKGESSIVRGNRIPPSWRSGHGRKRTGPGSA
jgi:hypothetical protein